MSHSRPLFYQLKSLNIHDMVNFKSMVFMYRVYNKLLPANIMSYFKKINACHIHNVRMKNCNFKIKFSRTNKKSECISVNGPKMWNDLPADIKLCTSMFTLKKMYLCNNNVWGMLLISLNFLHSPSTFSVCSIVPNNVQQCTMCGVQLLFSDCYYIH